MPGRTLAVANGQELSRAVARLGEQIGLEAMQEVRVARRIWGAERYIDVILIHPHTRKTLGLKGDEVVAIEGLDGDLKPLSTVPCHITYADGTSKTIQIKCRIDTEIEIEYVEHGGVLHYVLRDLAKA